MNNRLLKRLLAAVLAGALATPSFAQQPTPIRIRGTIVSVAGGGLVVRRTGTNEEEALDIAPDATFGAVKNVQLADVAPGTFVGVASMPGDGGTFVAKEVLVFPDSMRWIGDGHYPWDLAPGSWMTNANVETTVATNDGRTLTLAYRGGTKTVTVPAGAPVVTFADATRADVVAGKKVFVIVRGEPGKYTATRIVVEKDGVAPPM